MQTSIRCLLAQRGSDGKFLKLDKQRNNTSYSFVDNPEEAERVFPYNPDYSELKEAPYYFENSHRAREYWLKDCSMVAYIIVTKVIAVKI